MSDERPMAAYRDPGTEPFCDRRGCRGRWWPENPHTHCDKAPRSWTCRCGAWVNTVPETPICGSCGQDVRQTGTPTEVPPPTDANADLRSADA